MIILEAGLTGYDSKLDILPLQNPQFWNTPQAWSNLILLYIL